MGDELEHIQRLRDLAGHRDRPAAADASLRQVKHMRALGKQHDRGKTVDMHGIRRLRKLARSD